MSKGLLIVISGFSGVGKGTVIQMVLDELPMLKLSVSCTTRKPRQGEEEGVNYYFISKEEFADKVAQDAFIEHTFIFSNGYGTLKSEIEKPIENGVDVLMELNVVGAANVKKLYPDCISIFVCPPSLEALKARLIGRGSETEESLQARIKEIETESQNMHLYDYVVVNSVARTCAAEIVGIIKSKHLRTSRSNYTKLFSSEE